jgi:hypothetical protein
MATITPTQWLNDYDLYLFGEGTHHRAYEKLALTPGNRAANAGYTSPCGLPTPNKSQ